MDSLLLITPPSVEPVSLLEAKAHLRIQDDPIGNALTITPSVALGSHDPTVGFTILGEPVEAVPCTLCHLGVGVIPAGATLTAKVQESSDNILWTDAADGSFGTLGETPTPSTHTLFYEGAARYVRIAISITGAAITALGGFVLDAATSPDDATLTRLISVARSLVEEHTNQKWAAQTWDWILDDFPSREEDLPLSPLTSVTGIYYTPEDAAEVTYDPANYVVAIGRSPRLALKHGIEWPCLDLECLGGFRIRLNVGESPAKVPPPIKQAILVIVAALFENRNGTGAPFIPEQAQALLDPFIRWAV